MPEMPSVRVCERFLPALDAHIQANLELTQVDLRPRRRPMRLKIEEEVQELASLLDAALKGPPRLTHSG
ncbi:hypothetical protein ThidrDRAFT_4346 [Thiorhodococcus drewsii AZ1]|uniref:Uncharacterized protein n=1 Tax=Thiorhodococcus drewsii AZ1 TaxID=765913 RepID=G2E7T3_9GAMM|nr:hypothetical protein [Thiorhodococcus drewsii]EGV27844.1 hypothetical protein ThidrDRAFT_4346 [Thiorhodococcus drewsii AZ1]